MNASTGGRGLAAAAPAAHPATTTAAPAASAALRITPRINTPAIEPMPPTGHG